MTAADAPAEAVAPPESPEAPAASQALAVPDEVANPVTGEMIPTADLEAVGVNIDLLRRAKGAVDFALSQLTDAVALHARQQGRRTFNLEDLTVVLGADTEVEWDVEELLRGLAELDCPADRLNELVTTTVSYKVNASVAKQIAAANPDYGAVIAGAQRRVPKRAYASVKVKPKSVRPA